MHSIDGTIALSRNMSRPTLAAVVSVQAAELDIQAAGILLCLACQLAELGQRVLLVDLDPSNDIARYCGLQDLDEADQARITATSCLADNTPFVPHRRFDFNAISLIPAGMQGIAAAETLKVLASYPAGVRVLGAASLQNLREQYDFILIGAPPLITPNRTANPLTDFSMWPAHAVLVPYLTANTRSRQRLLNCAQFVRSARVAAAGSSACDVWILPMDEAVVDPALLRQLQERLAPHQASSLPSLHYQALMQELALFQRPTFEMRERISHIRRLSKKFLELVARRCLGLRE